MTNLAPQLARNRAFAATDWRRQLTVVPRQQLFLITCIDPRTDPAAFLGVAPGEAIVLRNAGGRVTDAVVADVLFISFLGERMGVADGNPLEVAVIHHTQCGTGFLADDAFRGAFAERTGFDDAHLARTAVTDPTATVRTDVDRLLAAPLPATRVTVSGHVLDLETGLVSTVVEPAAPHAQSVGAGA